MRVTTCGTEVWQEELCAKHCVVWTLREEVLEISLVLISTRKAVPDSGQKPKSGKTKVHWEGEHLLCPFPLEVGIRTQKNGMQQSLRRGICFMPHSLKTPLCGSSLTM